MNLIDGFLDTINKDDVKEFLRGRIVTAFNYQEYFIYCYLLNLVEKEETEMDKKMAQVTKEMKVAEKDVKKGKKAAAVKTLKKAEKKNVKLTKLDREVRDPMLKKCKKVVKKDAIKGRK